jgi:lipopolysaccharide export system permease protein
MGAIERYIFRTTFGAFAMVLVSLTALIWVTHALREIDLMTNQGQTILVFVGITGLLIPLLVLVIAPVALVIAVAYTLNKLNGDSEIIVMNAAGMSPWRLFRAFLSVALVVSVMVAAIAIYVAPKGLRELRNWATKVRADLVTNIVQPGRFTTIESGLIFHIRERRPNGQLVGILVDDRRDRAEHATFLAERGEIVENERGTFLVLENGSVQRQEQGDKDPAIVLFERYAFDLSRFNNSGPVTIYGVRERYIWDLIWPDPEDQLFKSQPGQFRAELNERIVAPLYPVVFVVIAYAFLGAPRTTRQSRGMSMGLAIAGVGGIRLIGFASTVMSVQTPMMLVVLYGSIAAVLILGLRAIGNGAILEPPAFVTNAVAALSARFARLAAPAS